MATSATENPSSPKLDVRQSSSGGPSAGRGCDEPSSFLSPGLSLRSDGPLPPMPTAVAPKRPRCQIILAVAAVLEDMIDVNDSNTRIADPSPFDNAVVHPEDLDALLAEAAPSLSAAVCAVVYAARVDHWPLPLSHDNVLGVAAAALTMGSMYVDRADSESACASIAAAAGLSAEELSDLVHNLVATLPNQETYISPASFREFQDLLDSIC